MNRISAERRPRPHPNNRSPLTSNLTLAELCLQRGDFDQSRYILEKRVGQGACDFKTLNLFAVSLAHIGDYDHAATIFQRLGNTFKLKSFRVKAGFNLGLVRFYQDLAVVGDLSVANYRYAIPGPPLAGFAPLSSDSFSQAITLWREQLRGRHGYSEIIHTYLSFASLQAGDPENALRHLISALSIHENFYISHYVLGRVFLDFFHLALEGNDFPLPPEMLEFFEIESYEVVRREKDRFVVQKETFLDIAMQAFLEGRSLNPLAPEISLSLAQAYLAAGMIEEATEALAIAEIYAPDTVAILETSLLLHTSTQAAPQTIESIAQRAKALRLKKPDREVYFIIPPYYLS